MDLSNRSTRSAGIEQVARREVPRVPVRRAGGRPKQQVEHEAGMDRAKAPAVGDRRGTDWPASLMLSSSERSGREVKRRPRGQHASGSRVKLKNQTPGSASRTYSARSSHGNRNRSEQGPDGRTPVMNGPADTPSP